MILPPGAISLKLIANSAEGSFLTMHLVNVLKGGEIAQTMSMAAVPHPLVREIAVTGNA